MLLVLAGDVRRSERFHQLLSIMGEFINGVSLIVYDPNVFFRIVRIDGNRVRTLQHGIPLRPPLDNVAAGIHHHYAIFPTGIDAQLAAPHRVTRRGDRSNGSVAKGHLGNRKRKAGPNLGIGNFLGSREVRYFATLEDKHAVRTLGEHALDRSPGPLFMPGQFREWLGPGRNHLVGPGYVLVGFFAWFRGEPDLAPGLRIDGPNQTRNEQLHTKGGNRYGRKYKHECASLHRLASPLRLANLVPWHRIVSHGGNLVQPNRVPAATLSHINGFRRFDVAGRNTAISFWRSKVNALRL